MKKRIFTLLCFALCCTLLPLAARAIPVYTVSAAVSGADRDAATEALDVLPGDTVTVTVSVIGGSYVGAACRLTYDAGKFVLDAAPEGWVQSTGSNVLSYFNVNGSNTNYADGTVLGTFTFRVKTSATAGTGRFTLSDSDVAVDWSEGWSNQPAKECAYSNASVNVLTAKAVQKETAEYVAGYSLVLVYTDDGKEHYAYDGAPMCDVTAAGYLFDDMTAYAHVYALVIQGSADLSKAAVSAAPAAGTAIYSHDVDASGVVTTADAAAVQSVYNTSVMADMLFVLRADVNGDKTVDITDAAEILHQQD